MVIMFAVCSTPSRHIAVFCSGSTPKPCISISDPDSPVPHSSAAARNQIERRKAFGNARGMIVVRRRQADAVAEADILGALRSGAEKHLGRRGVRVLLEEVVLDLPHVVEAEAIGELDLIERIVEQLLLSALAPGLRQLMFIEDAELHLSSSCATRDPVAARVVFFAVRARNARQP